MDVELDAFLRGAVGEDVHGVAEELVEIDGNVFDLHLGAFELREVEDVIDDMEQRFAGGADHAHELFLLRFEAHFDQKARRADDAIHGRADLMAHVCQEVAFRRGGDLRHVARGFELGEHGLLAQILLLDALDHLIELGAEGRDLADAAIREAHAEISHAHLAEGLHDGRGFARAAACDGEKAEQRDQNTTSGGKGRDKQARGPEDVRELHERHAHEQHAGDEAVRAAINGCGGECPEARIAEIEAAAGHGVRRDEIAAGGDALDEALDDFRVRVFGIPGRFDGAEDDRLGHGDLSRLSDGNDECLKTERVDGRRCLDGFHAHAQQGERLRRQRLHARGLLIGECHAPYLKLTCQCDGTEVAALRVAQRDVFLPDEDQRVHTNRQDHGHESEDGEAIDDLREELHGMRPVNGAAGVDQTVTSTCSCSADTSSAGRPFTARRTQPPSTSKL